MSLVPKMHLPALPAPVSPPPPGGDQNAQDAMRRAGGGNDRSSTILTGRQPGGPYRTLLGSSF